MDLAPRIRLFGPVTVTGPRESAHALAGLRQRALLTMLARHPGKPVPIPDLVTALWGQYPPSSVHNALQVHISGLRKVLDPLDVTITRDGATYTLECTMGEVDLPLFEALVASAQSLLRGDDAPGALKQLEDALSLAHAPLMAGLDVSAPLAQARRVIEEQRLAARRDLIIALYRSGHAERAVDEARALVTDDPLDEASWSRLMTAQYHAGRPHAALETYQLARQTLLDELGVEPSPPLVELQHAILNHQLPGIGAAPPSESPGGTQDLLGREGLIAEVMEALRTHRLVTLHGVGGVGKSALCDAIAARLAGQPVAVVDLMQYTDAAAALEAITRVLGLPTQVPDLLRGLSLAGPKIVIADNVERIDDFAALSAEMLAVAPNLRLLVTARRRLGTDDEYAVVVLPLDCSGDGLSTAEQLFIREAHRIRPDLEMGSATSEVRTLCQLSGGLPLAIQLLAARTRVASPARLLDQLQRSPEALAAVADSTDGRHTVPSVVNWAVNACSPRARMLLRALTEIGGPVSGHLADALSPHPDALLELANAGLVVGPTATDHFHVPGPITKALGPADEAPQQSLLDAVTDMVRPADGTQPRLEELINDQSAVIRAVVLSVRDGQSTLLLPWLHRFWLATQRVPEGVRLLEQALTTAGSDDAVALQVALEQLRAPIAQGDPTALEAALEAAEQTYWRQSRLVVNGWCSLGSLYADPDDIRRAADRARAAAGDDPVLRELAVSFAAHAAHAAGETERAVQLGLQSVQLLRRIGESQDVAVGLCWLVPPLLLLDDVARARACVDEVMEIGGQHRLGSTGLAASANAALVTLAEGNSAAALGMASVVLSKLHEVTYSLPHQVAALRCLALGHKQLGRAKLAAEFLGAADQLARLLTPAPGWPPAFLPIRASIMAIPDFAEHHAIGSSDPERVIQVWLTRVIPS